MESSSDHHTGVDSGSKCAIAKILKLISALFHAGNISQDQRVSFKDRALEKHPNPIDLHVLLTEVQVCEEAPEVGYYSLINMNFYSLF